MHKDHEIFISSIHERRHLTVCFTAQDGEERTRLCIPYDFGPSRKYKDGAKRYHFYDLDSPEGQHNLSILPTQIESIEILDTEFDPANFVTWTPTRWILIRDWGTYS
jgi:hypothetical protein